MYDTEGESEWIKTIPVGTTWTGPPPDDTSADVGITTTTANAHAAEKAKAAREKKSNKKQGASASQDAEEEPPFKGDRILARSISFMRDMLISRECAYAIAEGDSGRVYEILKVNASSHRVDLTLTI